MGTISFNDDTVIININHAICDGKYIVGVAHHIGDILMKPTNNYIPITIDEEFKSEVKGRLQKPPIFFRNDKNNTIFHGFGMKKLLLNFYMMKSMIQRLSLIMIRKRNYVKI